MSKLKKHVFVRKSNVRENESTSDRPTRFLQEGAGMTHPPFAISFEAANNLFVIKKKRNESKQHFQTETVNVHDL